MEAVLNAGGLAAAASSSIRSRLVYDFCESRADAYSRRKFPELHANNKSQLAEQPLQYIGQLYDVEREVQSLSKDERKQVRQVRSKPLADAMHEWMTLQRQKIIDSSTTAKALDYSLRRWGALMRFMGDGQLPIDNNSAVNLIRPIAVGRKNWLFASFL